MIPLIVLVVILAAVAFYFVGIYNNLVALRNLFMNAYTQIDIQLKRRYDLIPNLVEAAKGYLAHERGTLEAVIAARNIAVNASKTAAAAPGKRSSHVGIEFGGRGAQRDAFQAAGGCGILSRFESQSDHSGSDGRADFYGK